MPGRLAVTSHGASQANRVFVLNGEMGDVSGKSFSPTLCPAAIMHTPIKIAV